MVRISLFSDIKDRLTNRSNGLNTVACAQPASLSQAHNANKNPIYLPPAGTIVAFPSHSACIAWMSSTLAHSVPLLDNSLGSPAELPRIGIIARGELLGSFLDREGGGSVMILMNN